MGSGSSLEDLPDEFNIVEELLERHARAAPNSTAVITVEEKTLLTSSKLSYLELRKLVNKVGNALIESGVEREQRVAIMMQDGVESVAVFLASLKIGAVPILLSTYSSERQLLFLLNDARAKMLFADEQQSAKFEAISRELRFMDRCITLSSKMKGSNFLSFESFLSGKSEQLEAHPTSKNDVAFWFYTSGSTGMPKGVIHLHHDIHYAGLSYYDDVLRIKSNDLLLSAAKLYFSAGLGFGLYGPLIMGAGTVLFPGKPSAQTMMKIIETTRPTAFLSVPTLYAQVLQEMSKNSTFDHSSVRIFATGGEPLPPKVFFEWKRITGKEIIEAIGAAEVCHHYISNIPGEARPNTCGKIMKGYDAKIVDENGKALGPNQIGTLHVRGESTFVGYWHLHRTTKESVLGEWINTKDLFYSDDEGFFHFCGRTDFSFKAHGLWVSPIEIENAMMETGLVEECCVVPFTSNEGVSEPILYAVPKNKEHEAEKLASNIALRIGKTLSSFKIPRKVVCVPELPKTSVGKIDRSAIMNDARKRTSNQTT